MSEQQPKGPPHQQEAITKDIRAIPFRKAPDFTVIYANSVNFAASPWDLNLTFGQAITTDPNDFHVRQRVMVTLSPQAAKAMVHLLLEQLEAYERQFGEIRYTPIQPSSEGPSA